MFYWLGLMMIDVSTGNYKVDMIILTSILIPWLVFSLYMTYKVFK